MSKRGWLHLEIWLIAVVLFLISATYCHAQSGPFVPFTVDAAKYQQIDDAMAKQSMPREAHAAWVNLWQGAERQAQMEQAQAKAEAARKEKENAQPKP